MEKLKDLFIDEIKDLYNAEKQITKALPQMAKQASSEELKQAFEDHLKETEKQIGRLEQVFKELDIAPRGKKCEGIEGIISEGKEMMKEIDESSLLDAALISAAQKVEHYEIASYGTVRTYAEMLNMDKAVDLLQQTLDEESRANEKLTKLALSGINEEALHGVEEEDEE
jgi:ferritin-like metal-binding protein YciE